MSTNKLLVVRVLFLSPFASRPLYGGAVVRNHYLSRYLCRHHHVWASFCGPDGGAQYCGEVPTSGPGLPALFDPAFLWRAFRAIKTNKIEMIIASSLIAGLHGVLLKRLTGLPFWMDEHNVEWHCSRRYGHMFWWLIYLLEGFILRQADRITCVSEEDRQRLLTCFRLDPKHVSVAPNGVDYPKLSALGTEDDALVVRRTKRILFFGVLDYPPNYEAVEILGTHIAPRLDDDIDVWVAGHGGRDLIDKYPRIEFKGFVDDIHKLIRECDGVVVPILAGGGTRMKILETVACQRPVVSTTCGAEGINRQALGQTLTITDDYQVMANWVQDLKVGQSVQIPSDFVELYDWAQIWQNRAPI